MATHDYNIANASGAAVRQDINNALTAIVTNNSSDTEPATTFAHMLWLDTNNDILKIRNAANDAWIDWITQAGIHLLPDGAAATPSLSFASETDSGLYRIAANTIGIATSGTERVEISDTGIIINEGGEAAIDLRIEGDSETNLVFTDAGNDRVGIGEGAPDQRLHVKTSAVDVVKIESTSAGNGPNLTFTHTGASPADGDIVGKLTFEATNDNASTEVITFADIGVVSTDVSDGSEDSAITFSTRDAGTLAERARVDEDGRFLIGTSTTLETGNNRSLQVVNTSTAVVALGRNDDSITAGNDLGAIRFYGNDGGTYQQCAEILAEADGDHANDDKPSRLVFSTTADGASTPTERLRITNDGTIQLRNSTGIDFSQLQTNATGMTSETLDSYEEGAWTPVFAGGSTAGTYTYGTQVGRYTKIGRQVYVTATLNNIQTSSEGAGELRVTGLPFTPGTGSSNIGQVFLDNFNFSNNAGTLCSIVAPGETYLTIREIVDGGNDTTMSVTDRVDNTSDLVINCTYIV